jgi:hypothetical protein
VQGAACGGADALHGPGEFREAEKAFLAVRTPAGTRALAVITDADEAVTSTREDIAGAGVTVHSDGMANLL